MTTTSIISYIILALTLLLGLSDLFLIESRKKANANKRNNLRHVDQINEIPKASDLDKTTDQSTQRMTHEDVFNQDDHHPS